MRMVFLGPAITALRHNGIEWKSYEVDSIEDAIQLLRREAGLQTYAGPWEAITRTRHKLYLMRRNTRIYVAYLIRDVEGIPPSQRCINEF